MLALNPAPLETGMETFPVSSVRLEGRVCVPRDTITVALGMGARLLSSTICNRTSPTAACSSTSESALLVPLMEVGGEVLLAYLPAPSYAETVYVSATIPVNRTFPALSENLVWSGSPYALFSTTSIPSMGSASLPTMVTCTSAFPCAARERYNSGCAAVVSITPFCNCTRTSEEVTVSVSHSEGTSLRVIRPLLTTRVSLNVESSGHENCNSTASENACVVPLWYNCSATDLFFGMAIPVMRATFSPESSVTLLLRNWYSSLLAESESSIPCGSPANVTFPRASVRRDWVRKLSPDNSTRAPAMGVWVPSITVTVSELPAPRFPAKMNHSPATTNSNASMATGKEGMFCASMASTTR